MTISPSLDSQSYQRGIARLVRRLAFMALLICLLSTASVAWQVEYEGTETFSTIGHSGRAVGIDPGGNVLAAGWVTNTGSESDFFITKLSGIDGSELWTTAIDGPVGARDEALDAVVDSNGDIIVVGIFNFVPIPRNQDFAAIKLSGEDGSELWRTVFADPDDAAVAGYTVDLDASDNVIVGGSYGDYQFLVKLESASGSITWTGNPLQLGRFEDLSVNASGDVFAAGRQGNGSSRSFAVSRFNGDTGSVIWSTVLPGTGSDMEANGVTILPSGDVVAAGRLWDPSMASPGLFGVVSLDGATGEIGWSQTFGVGKAWAVASDSQGDAVAVGAFGAFKVDGLTGSEIWSWTDGPETGRDVLFDSADNALIGGEGPAFTISKLTPDGDLVWSTDLTGAELSVGGAFSLGLDESEDVVAAGRFEGPSGPLSGSAFAVAKLNGEDGSDFEGGPSFTCRGFRPPLHRKWILVRGRKRTLPVKAKIVDSLGKIQTDRTLTTPPVVRIVKLPANDLGYEASVFRYKKNGIWRAKISARDFPERGKYLLLMDTGDSAEYQIDPTCSVVVRKH